MKISYCITVHNEHEELKRLLDKIYLWKREEDEVLVQGDAGKVTREVVSVLHPFIKKGLQYLEFPLRNDFASFKNNLYKSAKNDWCFFIDADEYPHENLIKCLPELIDSAEYEGIEMMRVPRINTVAGLTYEWIKKWCWVVSMVDGKEVVNWPDRQQRLIKKTEGIHWVNKVHEVFTGFSSYSDLPDAVEWSLYHPKALDRQIKQNSYYETIG
jgi:glycosyltransferase involved in cell wall biosynthesis